MASDGTPLSWTVYAPRAQGRGNSRHARPGELHRAFVRCEGAIGIGLLEIYNITNSQTRMQR